MLIGEGELEEVVKEKAMTKGLAESVLFLGKRNDAERLYQAMDVFVLPSRYEGVPVVGVEAQAAGLPCVFSDKVTGETKILNSTTFVPLEAEPKKWAEAVNVQYVRRDTSEDMRKAGFDIEKQAEKMTKIYDAMNKAGGVQHDVIVVLCVCAWQPFEYYAAAEKAVA